MRKAYYIRRKAEVRRVGEEAQIEQVSSLIRKRRKFIRGKESYIRYVLSGGYGRKADS